MINLILMCECFLLTCIYVYPVIAYCPQSSEEGIGSPETGIMGL